MKVNPLTAIDLYKTNHVNFYDDKLTMVYQNFTPRSTKHFKKVVGTDDKIVLFGLQYFLKYWLLDIWQNEFFNKPIEDSINKYVKRMDICLGKDNYPIEHFKKLHKLGYLPIKIKALPEGSVVNAGIPFFTIKNTHPEFAWVPGFLEDTISNLIWRSSTSASISRKYKQIGLKYAKETTDSNLYLDFFFHDFQLRGTGGIQDAMLSGAGHLINFVGSDNVPAMDFLEEYYNATGLIGCGVVANEHSCVCSGGKENEFNNYKKWILEKFPTGILSLVSDTWDLWNVITNYLPKLKEEIMRRDGKIVIRPDSSPKTPLEIICGDPDAPFDSPQYKGVVQLLWEIFGGTTNTKGYKELDSHCSMIYGEAIQLDLLEKIYARLKEKGFAANCVVFGIGSGAFLYGISRDTCSWACKATACVINGEFREIWKDPVTDSGSKKSAKGLLRVDLVNGQYVLKDCCTPEEEEGGELKTVFLDGKLIVDYTLQEIRDRVATNT
jgi:nicotinamide phosphoribosyltransferase